MTVRPEAAVGTEVQADHAVTVRFSLHNVSRRSVKVSLWGPDDVPCGGIGFAFGGTAPQIESSRPDRPERTAG